MLDDPKLLEAVQRLRRQALACDEANGLNLLLAGEADAAVLPARRVLPLLRPPRLPLGNLALAGDWTDPLLPATIEAAVRSGEAAARALLRAA